MAGRSKMIFNSLAFAAMIAANILAGQSAINGMTTGEVSARYPNLFVPAGFTFSIWGVIYFLLFGFLVHGSLLLRKKRPIPATRVTAEISPLFQVSCLLNVGWIVAWHYLQVGLTVIVILCFLVVLIRIYQKLQPYRREFGARDHLWIYLPFTIYLGWISVASIANITALLVDKEWNGFGIAEENWSYIMIVVAALLGFVFSWFRKEWAYSLVIIWAIFGIYSAQKNQSGFETNVPLIAMAFLFLSVLLSFLRKNKTTEY